VADRRGSLRVQLDFWPDRIHAGMVQLARLVGATPAARGEPQRVSSEYAPRAARMETPQPNRGDKTSSGARGTKAHG
jgi:hypothetical protein